MPDDEENDEYDDDDGYENKGYRSERQIFTNCLILNQVRFVLYFIYYLS